MGVVLVAGVACASERSKVVEARGPASSALGTGEPEIEISGQFSVTVQPIDDVGGFVVVDGLASQADGSIGMAIWIRDQVSGFHRLDVDGPPLLLPTVWRVGSSVNVVGTPCPGITTAADRDIDRIAPLCSDPADHFTSKVPAVMLRIDLASGKASTVVDDLPAAIDPPAVVTPGESFTLIQAPRSFDADVPTFSFEITSLDNKTGMTTRLGAGGWATACARPSGGFVLFANDAAIDPARPDPKSSKVAILSTQGITEQIDIPKPPVPLMATASCAPSGDGAIYRSDDLAQQWHLGLEGDKLRWTSAGTLDPGGPDGLLPGTTPQGDKFGWIPETGTSGPKVWTFYRLISNRWVARGTIVSPNGPPQDVAISGDVALGSIGDLLKELP